MTPEPIWLVRAEVDHIHAELVREHGGSYGVRDDGLIESALSRPRMRWAYGTPDIPELAAAYAFGLARNHGYVDGNKRVAFMAAYTVLGLNGLELVADQAEAYAVMIDVASGKLSEDDLARWLRASCEARP
jgi:death on curing protein